MGVRAQESPRRAKQWEEVTAWRGKKGGWVVNPILAWSTEDVWQYIRFFKLPYCTLYDDGMKRLGCIGCPMSNRIRDFKRWPHMERLWRKAARRRWEKIKPEVRTKKYFKNADEHFDWWVGNKAMPKENDCQMGMF